MRRDGDSFGSGLVVRVLSFGTLLGSGQQVAYADPPPNVVVFLADDMGWTDWQFDATLNPTGSMLYETPNLLRLAQQSVSFTGRLCDRPTLFADAGFNPNRQVARAYPDHQYHSQHAKYVGHT